MVRCCVEGEERVVLRFFLKDCKVDLMYRLCQC